MKKTIVISIISLQVLTLASVASNAYFTFMNKARIRATQRVMVETQDKLASTFDFMDEIAANKNKTEQAKQPQTLAAGITAPEFSLQDENKNSIKLSDYIGKKTLLVFSQESCPYCKNFYPVLNEFQSQKADVNVVIMQIGSSPDQNKKYKQQERIKAPLLAATYNELQLYKVQVTPTSILLDEEGKVLGSKNVTQLADLVAFVENS